jgi:tripartite-type tricarboxylate transporter receptor subunit TctC
MRLRKFPLVVALAAAFAAPLTLAAQPAAPTAFPEKPIRLVIGSAPGSGPDIISRALSERLFGAWGQRVVVDSRPGVAGVLSADLVLNAPRDGYTWMMLTSQLLVATAVFPNVKFNLEKDFSSLSLIGTTSFVLVVNPEIPAKSIKELIEYAKKTPLKYGSAGTGASEHLSGVLFTKLTGTDMLHVPYKGVPDALNATMGKEVNLTYGVVPAVLGAIQGGRVRALGVTGPRRSQMLPDVPSISEAVPGYQTLAWYSVVAPAGIPDAILAKASAEIARIVKDPQFGEQLKGLGLEIVGSDRAELDKFRAGQRKSITEIVKISGVDTK